MIRQILLLLLPPLLRPYDAKRRNESNLLAGQTNDVEASISAISASCVHLSEDNPADGTRSRIVVSPDYDTDDLTLMLLPCS